MARLRDPEIRDGIRQQMANPRPGSKMSQFRSLDDVLLINCRNTPELAGKTMGIIGFGQIGQSVGAVAEALGIVRTINDVVIEVEDTAEECG